MAMNGEPQFRDQVDQFDYQQAKDEYDEKIKDASPIHLRPGYVHVLDEDELMELEREQDCE